MVRFLISRARNTIISIKSGNVSRPRVQQRTAYIAKYLSVVGCFGVPLLNIGSTLGGNRLLEANHFTGNEVHGRKTFISFYPHGLRENGSTAADKRPGDRSQEKKHISWNWYSYSTALLLNRMGTLFLY